jgi:hypothetical protein
MSKRQMENQKITFYFYTHTESKGRFCVCIAFFENNVQSTNLDVRRRLNIPHTRKTNATVREVSCTSDPPRIPSIVPSKPAIQRRIRALLGETMDSKINRLTPSRWKGQQMHSRPKAPAEPLELPFHPGLATDCNGN